MNNKLQSYIRSLDAASFISDEDVENTISLLEMYGPLLRQSARRLDEYSLECYESRRQSITDFIDLAIDFDHDSDRKRIADRLANMGHSMQLLSLLEEALVLVREDPRHNGLYYKILQARYFNAYCRSNEDAYLDIGISSSTYYRNIKPAQRFFAAMLWNVVIPDLIIRQRESAENLPVVQPVAS